MKTTASKKEPTPREVLTDINRGNIAPIYILMGEEAYYIDVVCSALENKVLTEDERDFNSDIFYGADVDIEAAMSIARQFPMMAQRRLVVIKEAQSMQNAKNNLEKLEAYMQRPSSTTVFVVTFKGDNLNATSKMLKAAKNSGAVVMKSPAVRDYQVASHIKDYCAARRISIDDKASAMLAEFLGTSLAKIFREIDKLAIALPEGATRITPELIEENIGISKDFNNFELISALAGNNYTKAMTIVDYFKRNPKTNPTVVTTSLLFGFYQKVLIAGASSDKSDNGLMTALKAKSVYALKDVRAALNHIPASKALKCIHAIRRFDAMSKGVGSFGNEYDLLQELVFKLFTLK